MCSFVRFEKNVGGWRGWFDDAREYHAQVKRGLQNLYLLQHVEETLQPAPGKTVSLLLGRVMIAPWIKIG